MVKKMTTVSLYIVFIVLFLAFLINQLFLKDSSAVSVIHKSESEFLSDEYFDELDSLIGNEKWHLFYDSKKIVSEEIINEMMDDLEKKQMI